MVDLDAFLRAGLLHTPSLVSPQRCAALAESWQGELGDCSEPLPRQHDGRSARHERSADGLVTNPVHNPHQLSSLPATAARVWAILANPALLETAACLLGGPAAILQTALYESSKGAAAHRDDHPYVQDAPMVGLWIALEPIVDDAGPFVLFPGSHLLVDPELDRLGRASWHARFVLGQTDHGLNQAYAARLHHHLAESQPVLATLPTGDGVWWDRRTVHGSRAPQVGARRSRCSLNIHFIRAADLQGEVAVGG